MATRSGGRRWAAWTGGTLAALVALTGAAYAATALIDVPPPHALVRLLATAPSAQGEVFPTRTVAAGPDAAELERAPGDVLATTVPWKGERISTREMLDETKSRALVVLHEGRIVDEWYVDGVDDETRLSSWSVAKSVVSLLVGQASERGDLAEDDRMVDILPELRTGGAYDDITVAHLLDMASGIDVSENCNPWWPFTGTARLLLSTDLPGCVAHHREVSFAPGSRSDYRSVDTQMLGIILERVDGRPLAQIAGEDLWAPMGAESDALCNLDSPDGPEKGFCGLNATARDFARIGQLVADGGRAGDAQIVPEAWIERISTPTGLEMEGGWGYSAQWWRAPGAGEDFLALGVYGQYIWVDPATDTVIVKLSDHGTEQDEIYAVEAMRAEPRKFTIRES
ncbi:serine hydrolase domain-containing protein [Microbacterium sp. gxy059]|uniref:serine hydrolase domain-containing protein n=1 Tax=Microbacterium sp. gxy059 TaxID=2957199 RepID=UPI003D99FE2E